MRWTMIGIGIVTVLLALVLAGAQLSRPQPRTAQEAIGIALQERGIAFDDLRVENGRCLPTPEQCAEYRADVIVIARQTHPGLMQCWDVDRECELWIADIGLDAPLPNRAPLPTWLGWVERLENDVAAWLHETLNRSYRPLHL
jgi:hypothetical protein